MGLAYLFLGWEGLLLYKKASFRSKRQHIRGNRKELAKI